MNIPKTIKISNGRGKNEKTYYYWSDYGSYQEAWDYAKTLKKERKPEMNLKFYVKEIKQGRFLPSPRFVVYLNKKLRLF